MILYPFNQVRKCRDSIYCVTGQCTFQKTRSPCFKVNELHNVVLKEEDRFLFKVPAAEKTEGAAAVKAELECFVSN